MFATPAARTHLAMVIGCITCSALTAYWLFTSSGPVGVLAEWARGQSYFQRQPHAWAIVSLLGPGMLGLAIAVLLLMAWSLVLVAPVGLRWFGAPSQGRSAIAEWWRFRSRHGLSPVLVEIGLVLVLFGFFTWVAGQNPALQKDWGRFQWLAIERNPEYLFRDYRYREFCGLLARLMLLAGGALAGMGMLLAAAKRRRG